MNLCIVKPNKYSYSETFIDNQVKELRPQLLLYEGWHPSVLPNGKSFLPFPLNFLSVRGALRNLTPRFYHKLYSFFLDKYFRKNDINVVLANYGPMGVELMNICGPAGIKLVVHFHGFDATTYKVIESYRERYKDMFEKVDSIIVVSNDMKRELISLGAREEKIYLNPYGVDMKKFDGAKPETKGWIYISVGRFTAKKAPQLTIKAFVKVAQVFPDARLIMIGDGELWEESKQLAKELNIKEKIDFKGKMSPEEISELLKEARVFVQHSLKADNGDSEGTPNTILEASATGLPIVSTLHAGIKDAVVHNETGFLVEEGNWEAMADYMIRLGEDSELAGRMGQAARKHMEQKYEMAKRLETLKEILTE